MIEERIPPQNIEAEQSVLGSILLDGDALARVIEILKPEDFYEPVHRVIYDVILELFDKGKAVDLITVSEALRKKGKLEDIGGVDYLTELIHSVPTSVNADYYAHIVREKAILRGLIRAGTEIARLGYEEDRPTEELVDEAEQLIFEIMRRGEETGFKHIGGIVSPLIDEIERRYSEGREVTGVPTGFREFDKLTSGFQLSSLNIIAARPSMGKTAFAVNIALFAACKERIPVAIFSLEMSKEQLAQRMLSSEARIDAQRIRTGFLSDKEWRKLAEVAARLSEAPIYVDDTPNISVAEIRARSRRLKAEVNLGLIIVDYLQLVQLKKKVESKQQEVSEVSRALKALARELNVPVVALSQLSRAVEQRQDRRPQLSDLRDSGAIEQDADLVAFIYREEVYKPDAEPGIAEIIVGKHRNGPVGTVKLRFFKEYTRFENLAPEDLVNA
ncbi:MAG: replicative DNA helicase [Synergistetes bacterium]|nr:replicative DNA helicase [Synergistota bacterium]MCX8127263.1 replicative DNA helicase [Synergistota bacterium]MDW8191851.1 replicative DNA helicase [Synergistota bacterium]